MWMGNMQHTHTLHSIIAHCPLTYLWHGLIRGGTALGSLWLEEVSQITIGHVWKDDHWQFVLCVKAHTHKLKDIRVVKVKHYWGLSNEILNFFSVGGLCVDRVTSHMTHATYDINTHSLMFSLQHLFVWHHLIQVMVLVLSVPWNTLPDAPAKIMQSEYQWKLHDNNIISIHECHTLK